MPPPPPAPRAASRPGATPPQQPRPAPGRGRPAPPVAGGPPLRLTRAARTSQALPGPKRVSVTMLREIDSAELGKLFARGIEDNMERARFSRLVPGVLRMSDIFTQHKKLLPGENFSVDWVPGQGAQVFVKGQAQGAPFQEPEFFQALLGIWLGPHPADEQLKKALLGG